MTAGIKSNGKKKSCHGFTVVECVVAVFIAAVVSSSTFALISHSRSMLRSASDRTRALNEARATMEYLRSQQFTDTKLNLGTHSLNLNGMRCNYTVTRFANEPDLKRIVVQADWRSAATQQMRQLELTSVVAMQMHP